MLPGFIKFYKNEGQSFISKISLFREMILEGIVTSGLGKGAAFLALGHYKAQIKEKLGFVPYTGTLNIIISKNNPDIFKKIMPIRISSIKKNNKAYGGASCRKISMNGIKGAIIIPDLTEHDETLLEIIAPINLKSKLKIKDGDKIKLKLEKN